MVFPYDGVVHSQWEAHSQRTFINIKNVYEIMLKGAKIFKVEKYTTILTLRVGGNIAMVISMPLPLGAKLLSLDYSVFVKIL